jgi:hypothetical protein
MWVYSYERLKLAQLLGQRGVFLTWWCGSRRSAFSSPSPAAFAGGNSVGSHLPRRLSGTLSKPSYHSPPGACTRQCVSPWDRRSPTSFEETSTTLV